MNKIELTGLVAGLILFVIGITVYIVEFSTVDRVAPAILSGATLIFLLVSISIITRKRTKK